MLRPADPHEAYRRVELDARVAGSRAADLVRLCLRDVDAALGQALWAHDNARPDVRRRALERAQNGLGALRLGVDRNSPMGPALISFYEGLGRSVIANQVRFDAAQVAAVRDDLDEVSRAMLSSQELGRAA
ncbi:MAG: flagellin [Alteraurantiacibacter sp.]